MRLMGSFHTMTSHGRSGSDGSSPAGRSTSTGAVVSALAIRVHHSTHGQPRFPAYTALVLGLDHLVYAVPDVDEASDWLSRTTGVRPVPGGRHLGLGSRNALASLGDGAYLELVGPDPDQDVDLAAHPFGLAGLTEPRLVTWAVHVEGIHKRVRAARERGY